jgi:hypothetical protein
LAQLTSAVVRRGALWAGVLGLFAAIPISFPVAFAIASDGPQGAYWTYNAGFNAISWFDTGFARRELAGTLIALFRAEPMTGSLVFHVLTYLIAAGAGTYAIATCEASTVRRVALSAIFLGVLARVALDVGRVETVTMALGLLAAWAARDARWTVCAFALSVALLFHETGLIILFPLVCAVSWSSGSWRRWRSLDGFGALLVLAISIVAYGLTFVTHPDLTAIGRRVHSLFPYGGDADVAVYINLTGFRGMATAICASSKLPLYPAHVIAGVTVCLLTVFGLQPERWRAALFVSVPAFVVLSLIATDIGRWGTLAIYSIFALAVILPMGSARAPNASLIAAIVIMVLLNASGDFRTLDFTPIPSVDAVADALWVKEPDHGKILDGCDPGWRAAIGL